MRLIQSMPPSTDHNPYEISGTGVRISKIRNLEADIALSLFSTGIRIIVPIRVRV